MKARTHRASRFALAAAFVASAAPIVPIVMAAPVAYAQGGSSARAGAHGSETSADAAARAKQHFQRGRELYQAGSYREAIAELEAAHTLDPTAKDLVYNLAIVNEKLGQIDEAIHYLHAYLEMDLEAQERVRAEATVKRLEGSKKEVVPLGTPLPIPAPTATEEPPSKPPPPQELHYGRVDAATLIVLATSVAGLAVGTVFAVKALGDQPSGLVSGKDGNTPASIQSDQEHAHTEGIIADVGLGVGVAALAITAYLYFGRTKATAPTKVGGASPLGQAPAEKSVPVVTVAAGGHGAVFVLGGTF